MGTEEDPAQISDAGCVPVERCLRNLRAGIEQGPARERRLTGCEIRREPRWDSLAKIVRGPSSTASTAE
ncbi:MAG: hypothetical protein KAY65_13480 [Planctomycetes bacterium]|nr:hypothetical protein [Planctomycetota bacterium]